MSVRFWEPGKEFHRIESEVMDTMRDLLSKGDLIMGALAARWAGRPATDGQPAIASGRQHIEDFEADLAARSWRINREVLLRIMSVLALETPNHIRLLELSQAEQWQTGWARIRFSWL